MSKKQQKPTGKLAHISFDAGALPNIVPLDMPETKKEIELWICQSAIFAMKKAGQLPYDLVGKPILNEENDLDFTLPTSTGPQFLELMEIHTCGPYDAARTSYAKGGFVDDICKEINKKVQKYGASPQSVRHLLLYSIDFRFVLSPPVSILLAWNLRQGHNFRTIVSFRPSSREDGFFDILFPRANDSFTDFDESRARMGVITAFDLTKPIVKAKGSVEFKFDRGVSRELQKRSKPSSGQK